MRADSPLWSAQPNAGHRAIVDIERAGKLHGVVTQNIDELHQRAGTDPELVIEVHGTAWWTRCLSCGDRRPMAETLERVRGGEEDPPCLVCGGILKSDTISFGQSLVPEVIDRAMAVEPVVRRAARRRLDAQRLSGGQLRADGGRGRGQRGDHQRRRRRRWTRSPGRCCAVRSPSCCRPSSPPRRRPRRDLSRSPSRATGRRRNAAGAYTMSTRGRTLAEEGFIHAAYEGRWRTWSTATTPTSTSSSCSSSTPTASVAGGRRVAVRRRR